MTGVRLEAVQNVPLFIDWNKQEVQEVARLFNEHRFVKNEIVVKEGLVGTPFSSSTQVRQEFLLAARAARP